KLTIGAGISCLVAGDTLYVRQGFYSDIRTISIPGGTSWSNPVMIKAYPGEIVTVPALVFDRGAQYIIIDNFVIDGISAQGEGIWIGDSANHIRIQNSEIKNTYASGIGLSTNGVRPSDNNEFINLKIHDIGRAGGCDPNIPCPPESQVDQPPGYGRAHALYISTANNVFDHLEIYNIGEYGFHVYAGTPNNNVIKNSRVSNVGLNPTRRGWRYGQGMTIYGSGNEVYNNIVFNNLGSGDDVVGGIDISASTNSKIYNNIVYNNGPYPGGINMGGAGNMVKNNIVYQNTGGDIVDVNGQGGTEVFSNNLCTQVSAKCAVAGDPKFVNPASGDFHLQSTSPAINAGVNLGSPYDKDFDGVSRPQGSAYDIGAYEYGGTVSPTPISTPTPTPTLTTTTTLPPAPTGLSAVCSTSGNQVTVSWSPVSSATSYYLRIDDTTNNTAQSWYNGDPDIYLDQYALISYTGAVTSGRTYSWWVHGANTAGIGSSSSGSFTCNPSVTTSPASTKFSINDRVQVSSGPLNVRQTANGTLLGTQTTGALGTVTGGPTNTGGFNWWNINYDSGADGWSVEDYLVKYTVAPSPTPTPTPTPTPHLLLSPNRRHYK
ncbi:MAG: hypothetical protein UV94_C0033G0003, partial [Parcubacteria group bacterium GW2011_GWC1_43_30]